MALLSWSKQYEIGNDLIDNEHEELFRLINRFHTLWLEARDRHDIAKVLNQLVSYAEMHFRHEEQIMEDAGFSKLEVHRKVHESLIETIFELQKSYEEKSLRLEMETMKFVKSWLVDHILMNDYQFRDFLSHKKNTEDVAAQ